MVECLTRDRGAAGSRLTGVTVLCPLSKNINPSLVLVQPRKTRPFITGRLMMGRKAIKQNTNNMQCARSIQMDVIYHGQLTISVGESPW